MVVTYFPLVLFIEFTYFVIFVLINSSILMNML